MFERIGWFVEIVNVILCLHFLYGKKIKSKFTAGILILAGMLVLEIIDKYSLDKFSICIVYILFWMYILVEFGNDLRKAILSLTLLIILTGLLQLVACLPWVLTGVDELGDFEIIIIQLEVLILILLLQKILNQLFYYLLQKNRLIIIIVTCFAGYIIYETLKYKDNHGITPEFFIVLVVFGILISVLAYCWQKEREQRKIKELELQINNLCEASFRELIETIRVKQHDFYNHINTLQSQHYTIHTYDELVYEQEKYCKDIIYDNRFYHLLNSKSPVISGFLYGKFMEADKKGIDIQYSITLNRMVNTVPEFVIVEMIGILWDNAVDYVDAIADKKIHINITENESYMRIQISNPVKNISYNDITSFFQKGYSRKENHSGIGLNKIVQYAEKYHVNLKAEKIVETDTEWLCIELEIIRGDIEKQ